MKYYIKKLIQFIGYNLTLPFIFLKYNQTPLSIYEKQEIEDSYLKFKKYFKNSLISNNDNEIRDHIIKSAIELSEKNDYFLEFGVFKARTINQFAKNLKIKNKEIYGFDSFKGLSHDWYGSLRSHTVLKGVFKLNKLPKVDNNVNLIKGLVEETLVPFLRENNPQIIFVHIDLDIYGPTKYVLQNIKKYCKKGTIILFDELYGYPGWKEHEFRALNETFNDDEYDFIAFGKMQVAIKLK